jgi:hypothetical protein
VPFDRATVPLPDHDPAYLAKGLEEVAWLCAWADDPHSKTISAPRGSWRACEKVVVSRACMVRRLWHPGGPDKHSGNSTSWRVGTTGHGGLPRMGGPQTRTTTYSVFAMFLVLTMAPAQQMQRDSFTKAQATTPIQGVNNAYIVVA